LAAQRPVAPGMHKSTTSGPILMLCSCRSNRLRSDGFSSGSKLINLARSAAGFPPDAGWSGRSHSGRPIAEFQEDVAMAGTPGFAHLRAFTKGGDHLPPGRPTRLSPATSDKPG
jgi:hypothetical protein